METAENLDYENHRKLENGKRLHSIPEPIQMADKRIVIVKWRFTSESTLVGIENQRWNLTIEPPPGCAGIAGDPAGVGVGCSIQKGRVNRNQNLQVALSG